MTDQARVALYQRVSVGTADAVSLQQQNQASQVAVARRTGWRVVATYQEAVSASRFAKRDRPEWRKLLNDARLRKFDVVVLWEPSRGDRKMSGWSEFLDVCRDNGIRIYVTRDDRIYDVTNLADWRALAQDGIDSHTESEKISARAKRGIASQVANGRPHGRIPYGYQRRYENDPVMERKVIIQEPRPDQAPVVKEIIERISGSEPVSVILRDFAERGIPSPTGRPTWARSTLTHLVLDGVCYIGKRRHNGGPLQAGEWPAIVSEDVFWKAVNVLQDPARKAQADARGGIRPGRAKHLLSYIAKCDACGIPLSVQSRVTRAGLTPYYRCPRGCAVIPVEYLDDLVSQAVVVWASSPVVYATLTADDAAAVAARAERDAAVARMAQYEAMAASDEIDPESAARIIAGIKARIAALDERVATVATPAPIRDLTAEEDISARWTTMPVPAKRAVVRAIFGVVRLRPAAGHRDGALHPGRLVLRFTYGKTTWPDSAEKGEAE